MFGLWDAELFFEDPAMKLDLSDGWQAPEIYSVVLASFPPGPAQRDVIEAVL